MHQLSKLKVNFKDIALTSSCLLADSQVLKAEMHSKGMFGTYHKAL